MARNMLGFKDEALMWCLFDQIPKKNLLIDTFIMLFVNHLYNISSAQIQECTPKVHTINV